MEEIDLAKAKTILSNIAKKKSDDNVKEIKKQADDVLDARVGTKIARSAFAAISEAVPSYE